MKVCLHPSKMETKNIKSGIDVVVYYMLKYLPQYGVEFVDETEDYDVFAAHIYSPNKIAPDVVHSHGLYPTGSSDLPAWTWASNAKIIEDVRKSFAVTVPSRWVGELYARNMGFWPDIVPHGLDITEWPEPEVKKAPVLLWNKNRDGDVCFTKPISLLAKAAPNFQIISTFGEPSRNVSVTGTMPHTDMKELLYETGGIYLATTKETFGIGILEAMACGMPILGWRWGNVPYLAPHEKCGYMAKPWDIEDTKKGAEYIMDNYERLSIAAREEATKYTWEIAAEKYVEVYEKTVSRKSSFAKGLVSVVIPCYNYERYVAEAIESVKAQTYPEWECIIVDDGSTDNSVSVIREEIAGDNRFTLVIQPNSGVSDARNHGAMIAQGVFLSFLDADDVLLPHALDILSRPLRSERSIGLSYGKLGIIDAEGTVIRERGDWPGAYNVDDQFKRKNQVPSFNMMRRDVFIRTGGFRQHTKPTEDAELWTRIPMIGYYSTLATRKPAYLYRVHGKSATASQRDKRAVEPNWLNWISPAHGGPMPFAAVTYASKQSHPVYEHDVPDVSIITAVGESHKDLLRDAIESVSAQTEPLWEHIIIDDTDDGNLRRHGVFPYEEQYPWIRWLRNPKLHNVSAARNWGVDHARGKYICFLDADDGLHPNFLNKTLFVSKQCEDDSLLVYTDWVMQNGKGKNEVHRAENFIMLRLLDHALFAVTFVHPRDAFYIAGGFDETLALWEDWDYMIRLGLHGYNGIRIPEPLFVYRYHTGKRREESLANKTELLALIRGRYSKAPMRGAKRGCGSCGSPKPPKYPTILSPDSIFDPTGKNLATVRYVLPTSGSRTFACPSGKKYRFDSQSNKQRLVRMDDAAFMVNRWPQAFVMSSPSGG